MTASDRDALRQQLIREEGLRLTVYRCPRGFLSIGVGRNLETTGISDDEARYLLDQDITRCIRQLAGAFPWFADLDVIRQRALVDLCFNLGLAGLSTFTHALAALARSDFAGAATEFETSGWFRQVGGRGARVVAMIRTGEEAA